MTQSKTVYYIIKANGGRRLYERRKKISTFADELTQYIQSLNLNEDVSESIIDKISDIKNEKLNSVNRNLSEFTFDFKIKWLERYYSATSPENAWRDVRKFMIKNGFTAKSDTDYISNEPLTSVEFDMIKNSLRIWDLMFR